MNGDHTVLAELARESVLTHAHAAMCQIKTKCSVLTQSRITAPTSICHTTHACK